MEQPRTTPTSCPPSLSPPSLDEALEKRIADLTAWLREIAPECDHKQRHLDDGTVERAYWHYGYLMALRDLRDLIGHRRSSLN
jgi:hypothetical protein